MMKEEPRLKMPDLHKKELNASVSFNPLRPSSLPPTPPLPSIPSALLRDYSIPTVLRGRKRLRGAESVVLPVYPRPSRIAESLTLERRLAEKKGLPETHSSITIYRATYFSLERMRLWVRQRSRSRGVFWCCASR